MQKIYVFTLSFTLLFLAACGNSTTATATATNTSIPVTVPPTATADPCAPQNIKAEVSQTHQFTRAFDDAYQLAAILPRDQLAPQVSKLQDIRRAAEDHPVPVCLTRLKQLQILQMNTAINVFLAFINNADNEAVNQGVALTRQQHDNYLLELAKLIGATVVAPPSPLANAQATAVSAPEQIIVINAGSYPINLRASASMTSETVSTLEVGQSAVALGRSENNEWVLIELAEPPGEQAWAYASLIQFTNGALNALPIVTPAP
ncbi:MAG: hypothetical protein LC108_06795 [Anaerolineales bacterium]|nr:hypothetical protein [Anaerolineales bacterium]